MEKLKKIGSSITAVLDFMMKYFKLLILILIVAFIFHSDEDNQPQANLAKLYLKGPIYQSEEFREQVERIKKLPNIKGVLLIIDSPGGSVGASIEIANLIKELRDSMPIITHVEGVMASGSYYAGMYSDKIIANRGAMIGSIGVIFSSFNIKPLLNKLGIQEQTLQEGTYKSMGTFLREWNPQEKEFLQNFLKEQYKLFVSDVLQTRNLNQTDPKVFANGKIFTAKEALNLGLIDLIGSQSQAEKELCEITQIKKPIWLKKSKTEQWIDRLSQASITIFTNLIKGSLQ